MSCDLIISNCTCHIVKPTTDRVNVSSVPETRQNFTWKEKIFVSSSILRQSNGLSNSWLEFIVLLLLLICISLNKVKMVNSSVAIGCTNHAKPDSGISFHAFPHKKFWITSKMDSSCEKNWVPNKYSLIYSDHFEPSCFAIRPGTVGCILYDNSVPIIFPSFLA